MHLTEMNEVVRSKNDLVDHFNEENRWRTGWLGRNLNGVYVRSDNSESKKVGQGDLPTLDLEVGRLLVVRL